MVLCDKQIRECGEGLIAPFDESKVNPVSYDLTIDQFCVEPGDDIDEVSLCPGESAFVKSKEAINLPNNILANVTLRNGRIRQGLDLTAPVYFPGHNTRVFFRITNVSTQTIKMRNGDGVASIMFEKLKENVEKPYSGTFQNEFEYSGMSSYTSVFSKSMESLNKKIEDVNGIERSIYGNVLAIMAIFVAIFSLININVTLIANNLNMKALLTVDFVTVGSIGFLLASISMLIGTGKRKVFLWIACIVAFAVAIILQFI